MPSTTRTQVRMDFDSFLSRKEWDRANQILVDSADHMKMSGNQIFDWFRCLAEECPGPEFPRDLVRTLVLKLKQTVWWDLYRSCSLSENESANFYQAMRDCLMHGSGDFFAELVPAFVRPGAHWASVLPILEVLWRDYLDGTDSPLNLNRVSSRDLREAASQLQDLRSFPALREVWEKTDILLRTAHGRYPASNGRPWLVTHALAECNSPQIVLWLAIVFHPDQAQTRDHRGRLPLHYAARFFPRHLMNGPLPQVTELSITLLLQVFPEGAKFLDNDGKLPLYYALEHYRTLFPFDDHNRVIMKHMVNPLVDAAPEALVSRDMGMRLYPYQHAAAHGAPLDAVFRLLLSNPAVVRHRARSWLENENESLHAENASLKAQVSQLKQELAARCNTSNSEESTTPTKRKQDGREEELDDDVTPDSKRVRGLTP